MRLRVKTVVNFMRMLVETGSSLYKLGNLVR